MSFLPDLLRADQEAVQAGFGVQLQQAVAEGKIALPWFWEEQFADGFDSLLAWWERRDDALLEQWVLAIIQIQMPLTERLAAVDALGAALRVPVVERIRDQDDLLVALGEIDNGLAVLRRALMSAAKAPVSSQVEQLQHLLDESEARKSAIFETSLDPIITIDERGRIMEFNRAAERTFGRSRSQVLGQDPADVLAPAAHRTEFRERLGRHFSEQQGSLIGKRVEVIAARASGDNFPVEMAMTVSSREGRPVFTFFLRDISERQRAEQERARHAAELARSNTELEQFAYVASHDLQEPLRKVQAFGERIQSKYGALLPAEGQDYLARMQNAATRMQALINGLLALSRITTRGSGFVKVDLNSVVREVLADLEVRVEQTQAQIDVGRLPSIEADPLQMRQLWQNLLGNSLKFHRPGVPPSIKVFGRLISRRDPAQTAWSVIQPCCQLTIEDNGIGFDNKDGERIFQVFQRLHARGEYEGTGIGLAICRKIVERHGGTITAHGYPGQGAAFVVTLPVTQPISQTASDATRDDEIIL